jgi:hypothetical protein
MFRKGLLLERRGCNVSNALKSKHIRNTPYLNNTFSPYLAHGVRKSAKHDNRCVGHLRETPCFVSPKVCQLVINDFFLVWVENVTKTTESYLRMQP